MSIRLKLFFILIGSCLVFGCSSTGEKKSKTKKKWSDEKIDTLVEKVVKEIEASPLVKVWNKKLQRPPRIFLADIQNQTLDPHLPIDKIRDELYEQMNKSAKLRMVNEKLRSEILKSLVYYREGKVEGHLIKKTGQNTRADLFFYGAFYHPKEKVILFNLKGIRVRTLKKALDISHTLSQ